MTLLLGFGVLHVAGRWLGQVGQRGTATSDNSSPSNGGTPGNGARPGRLQVVWLVFFVLIPALLAAVTLRSDILHVGQSEHGLAPMIATHFFEHSLDYGLVSLLVLAGGSALLARG